LKSAAGAEIRRKNEMEKVKMNTKKLKYGTVSVVITVIVVAAIVLANVILSVVAGRINMKIDLTENNVFNISQESIDYLSTLNEPVEIVTMADETTFSTSTYVYYKQAYEVLKKYAVCSDKVTVNFVDMTKNPTYVNKYSQIYKGTIDQYSIVVSCGQRIKVLSINDLYNTEIDYNTFTNRIVSSKAEQVITSAIMYVTDPDPMKAVIFSSAAAGESNDNISSMLEDNGFETVSIDPITEEIPEDTDLIVINAPTNDYPSELIDKLYKFLENDGKYGKNLIYTADFNQKSTPNIDAFLSEWGLQVGAGMVAESDGNNVVFNSPYAIASYIPDTLSDTYANNIAQKTLPVISYYSRPVNILFETSGIIKTTPLITTNDTTYVITNEMQEAYQKGEDVNPIYAAQNTMAVSAKTTYDENNKEVSSHVLVVGSSYFFGADLTQQSYCNNGDLFVSAVNYMTGKTDGITIVAKDLSSKTFTASKTAFNVCFIIFVLVIPIVVLVFGVIIWVVRRHK